MADRFISDKVMRVLLILFFLFVTFPAFGEVRSKEEELYASFEMLCLDSLGMDQQTKQIISHLPARKLDEEKTQLLLQGLEGEAWHIKGENLNFILTLTAEGACSVTNPEVDAAVVVEIFEKHSTNKLVDTQKIGSQTQNIYQVDILQKDVYKQAYVLLTVSNLSSISGVILNSIPVESVHKKSRK